MESRMFYPSLNPTIKVVKLKISIFLFAIIATVIVRFMNIKNKKPKNFLGSCEQVE